MQMTLPQNRSIKLKLQKIGWDIIWKPLLHFLSSGCAGLLVYWLTSTIFSHLSYGDIGILSFGTGGFSIHLFSLVLALSFSVLVHIGEDYILDWF